MSTKRIHNNKPQLLAALVQAWLSVHIWGRRTGKTAGALSNRTINNIYAMPQSTGAFVNHTYQSLLGRTLPSLHIGLSKWGFERGRDYHVGRFGPKSWKKPIFCPDDPSYMIHFRNGSGILLSTQHGNIGNINGATIDWGATDEAKYLNKQKFDEEVTPALSGNSRAFKELSCFGSWLFISDMPRDPKANWLFDYKKLMDPDLINLIIRLSHQLSELRLKAMSAEGSNLIALNHKIKTVALELNNYRKGSIYYSEASTLDNIEVLGVEYLTAMKKTLPELEYRMSILNEHILQTDLMFYQGFQPSYHGYHANDNEMLHNIYYQHNMLIGLNCSKDTDINHKEGLHIALDYGAAINCVVTGQLYQDKLKVLSGMHVMDNERLSELAKKWCDYYEPHRKNCNVLHFYYDHTAVGTNALSTVSYQSEWVSKLVLRGWKVISYYIGQQPGYDFRLVFMARFFSGDKAYPRFSYNRDNCESLEHSLLAAGTRELKGKREKDKSSEHKNSPIPANHATHYSDAFDTLAVSVCELKPRPVNPTGDGPAVYV